MAPAQMALPVDRRNGASVPRPPAQVALPDIPAGQARAAADVEVEQVPVVEQVPAPVVGQPPEVEAVPVWVRRITTGAVLSVALVAAVASYEHMRALAEIAGEGWRSWLLPISVDGLAVAASMTMLVRRRAGQRSGALAWAALLLGLGASLAANVAAAEPTVVGRLVAAWPPVGLLLSYELLMQQIKARGGPGVQPSAPVLSNPSNGGSER